MGMVRTTMRRHTRTPIGIRATTAIATRTTTIPTVRTIKMVREISAGDILAFRGLEWTSQFIDFGTFGYGRGYSHLALVSGHKTQPNLLLWESSYGNNKACVVAGEIIDGVQAHQIKDIFDRNCEVYHYPLAVHLTLKQQIALEKVLDAVHKRPYDYIGAFRAGGSLWAKIQSFLRGENINQFFCSELVAHCYESIGLVPADVNASAYSPNRLIKYLSKQKLLARRTRIK